MIITRLKKIIPAVLIFGAALPAHAACLNIQEFYEHAVAQNGGRLFGYMEATDISSVDALPHPEETARFMLSLARDLSGPAVEFRPDYIASIRQNGCESLEGMPNAGIVEGTDENVLTLRLRTSTGLINSLMTMTHVSDQELAVQMTLPSPVFTPDSAPTSLTDVTLTLRSVVGGSLESLAPRQGPSAYLQDLLNRSGMPVW